MLRLTFYSVLILFLSAENALAQEQVRARAGEHSGYSRLVFDWGSSVSYTVETSSQGKLVIEFQEQAKLDSSGVKIGGQTNILGFGVLSENPLKVELSIPEGSKTRNFRAGQRVVIDIYDPPGGSKKTVSAQPAQESKKPKPEKPTTKTESKAEKIKEIKNEALAKVDEEHSEVIVDEPSQEGLEEHSEPKIPVRPNLIALSTTETMDLAVFELNNQIWMVTGREKLVLTPQISGPDTERLSPLETEDVAGSKVFKAKTLPDTIVRGQGGGLLWRIIISPERHDDKPVDPVREGLEVGKARSGKILFPFKEPGKILEIPDPYSGRVVKVITVKDSENFAGPARDFVDFSVLTSPVGLAILPKVDDLEVKIITGGVEISRPGGLALATEADVSAANANRATPKKEEWVHKEPWRRIYDFKNWQMGGMEAINQNHNIILGDASDKPANDNTEVLLILAKMYLANGMGAEALGYLDLASNALSDLEQNVEFIALKGAAKALDGKSEEAFADLSEDGLEIYEELGYWKAFVLADLGDWQQAAELAPLDYEVLYGYPSFIFNRVALAIAEIALRSGNLGKAKELLKTFDDHNDDLFPPQQAALQYLKGEAARQDDDIEIVKEYWEPLKEGHDDLYRAKAGLALTRLLVDKGELPTKKAIDNLERLRYAWRGDDLEAQINYWLGKTYFEAEEFVKGLNIMREAASFSSGTRLGPRIAAEMSEVFTNLFLGDGLKDLTPLAATALYEQFAELVPTGAEGNQVVEALAVRLVEADLLERAARLLDHQIEHRLEGVDDYRIGAKLATIYLIDKKPAKALDALENATEALKKLPQKEQTPQRYLGLNLLRSRALAHQGRADQALELLGTLESLPSVNRHKAEIAWNAAYWDDAAHALGEVIIDENISLTRPLSEFHANMFLHRAVALNLANDRIALANMREKYSDAMAQTQHARIFEVITRPRQSSALADRETLLGIVSEVDLFGDFLKNYKAVQAPSN